MSNGEQNPGDMWEDGSDTQRSPAGYIGIERSNGQKAFSMVGSSNGSPALASSQSDGPVDLTTAETTNKVDCMGAGVRPAPSAGPPHQTSVWAKPPTFDGVNMGWEEFIMQFNACATINGWVGPEIGLRMFLNLEGRQEVLFWDLGFKLWIIMFWLRKWRVGLVHLGTGCVIVDGIMGRQPPPMPLIFSGWWEGHFQGVQRMSSKSWPLGLCWMACLRVIGSTHFNYMILKV